MGNRFLSRVMSTYLRPFNVFLLCITLPSLWLLTIANGKSLSSSPILPMLLVGQFLGLNFAMHLKRQFAQPCAVPFMPGFALPHLAAGACWLCFFVSQALLLPVLRGQYASCLPTAAVVLGYFTLMFWIAIAEHTVLGAILLLMSFAFYLPPASRALAEFLHNGDPLATAGMIAGSVALLVWWGTRLVGLREEDPAYHRIVQMSYWERMRPKPGAIAAAHGAGRPPILQRWPILTKEGMLDRILSHRGASPSRLALWRIHTIAPWSTVIVVTAIAGAAFFGFIRRMETIGQRSSIVVAFDPFRLIVLLPGFILVAMLPMLIWGQQCISLGQEFGRPLTRPQIIRRLGAAMALDFARNGLAGLVTIAVVFYIDGLSGFTDRRFWAFALLFVATIGLKYGATVWLIRYRRLPLQFVCPLVILVVGFFSAFVPDATTPALAAALPIAGVLLLLGCLLSADAYRRWLVMDIE